MGVYFFKGVEAYKERTLAIGTITVLLASLFVIYVSNDINKNVIVVTCTFGIIFSFTTSFNHAIDEKKHFMSALNVSLLNFDFANNPLTDKQIEELPQLTKFTAIDQFLKNNYEQQTTDEVNLDDAPSTPTSYSVITYLASGAGIAIARFLKGSIIDMYIAGRIMNLIVYTILIYIAMRILPFKKNIFFIIAFMPYMLLLAASYSIDGICFGTLYIFCAYCLKLYKECETISLKQFVILAILFGIMLIGKGVGYMGVGILIFMLPLIKTIKKNKKYIPIMIVCGIIFVILATAFIIYMKNTQISSEPDTRGAAGINGVEQLKVILTHPIFDIKLAIYHFKTTLLCFNWYVNLHQGTFFTKNAEYTMFVILLFVLYVSLTEDEHNFKIKDKIILIIAFLLAYGLTSVILYLSFTPVGVLYIAGYQTRYIFPILPLVLSCISNNKVKYMKTENRNRNVAIGSGILLLIGMIQLILV
jgi:uncharacterized membrane protein